MDLLPQGRAWPRDLDTNWAKLLGVESDERKSNHDRKAVLLDVEGFPTTSVELLPEWEQMAGLPDTCEPLPGSLAERWAALADIFFADHPPTPDNMTAWAAQAGWNIAIREQCDFVAGVSMAGDVVGESDHVWVVTVLDLARTYFRGGQAASQDPLWNYPDLSTLECVLRRANPGHLLIFFIVPG